MDTLDNRILDITANGIPLVDEPYRDIADRLGISVEELLARLSRMKDERLIRRFAASLDQHTLGINANAVVAWKVPRDHMEKVAEELVNSELFSHCYERAGVPGIWEYDLYTVVHGRDEDSVLSATVRPCQEDRDR